VQVLVSAVSFLKVYNVILLLSTRNFPSVVFALDTLIVVVVIGVTIPVGVVPAAEGVSVVLIMVAAGVADGVVFIAAAGVAVAVVLIAAVVAVACAKAAAGVSVAAMVLETAATVAVGPVGPVVAVAWLALVVGEQAANTRTLTKIMLLKKLSLLLRTLLNFIIKSFSSIIYLFVSSL
jgi:hypothetical protein